MGGDNDTRAVMRAALVVAAFAGLFIGCAPQREASFVRALAAADRAKTAGRDGEAADAYAAAAAATKSARERDYALFLAASSYAHALNRAAAARIYEALGAGAGEYAVRARYERARLELAVDEPAGITRLEAFALRDHESALARRALTLVATHRAGNGAAGRRAFYERVLPQLRGTALEERVRYEIAVAQADEGDRAAARAALLALATDFPYPQGALFDDALLRAGDLALALGDAKGAIESYERLLRERERAHLVGSYERRGYLPAAERIATVYRDKLGDLPRARAAFLRIVDEFTHSTARDDALFDAALVALRAGDGGDACSLGRRLAKTFPASRYAACDTLLCDEGRTQRSAATASACADYIARRIEASRR